MNTYKKLATTINLDSQILLYAVKNRSFLHNWRWPSLDPRNFSELKPNDPSSPSRMPPPTYCPTHDRTLPPPDQAVGCFSNSVVVEHIDQHAEEKVSMKRASCDDDPAPPERAPKMPRADPPYHNA